MADAYTREQVLDIIEDTAKKYDIPSDDFLRFSSIETGGTFNPSAINSSGAKGLFQMIPRTAKEYGISGHELDPKLNADAGARFYEDNRKMLISAHAKDKLPYLSGEPQPSGLDMYLAHQQGAAGYHSLQDAIATGHFTGARTRTNILNNLDKNELRTLTGTDYNDFVKMSDGDMAKTFSKYWEIKYDLVSIPEKNVAPLIEDPRGHAVGSNAQVIKEGARDQEVRDLQTNLAALGYSAKADGDFGPATRDAVERFQSDHHLTKDGVVGPATQHAIQDGLSLQTQFAQGQWLDDPRNPANSNHALFNEMKRIFPDASENRLMQFTAACHVEDINERKLEHVHFDQQQGLVGFGSGGWAPGTAIIDVKQPSPQPEQSIQQIQQHDQQQAINQAQLQAQQMQINQQQTNQRQGPTL
jgi:hypothetical protein